MFDLITGDAAHIPQRPLVPLVVSTSVQAALIATIVAVPMLFMTEAPPTLPTMMAFVAAPSSPPPPPPPPLAPARKTEPAPAKPVPTTGARAAPTEMPSRIEPEAASAPVDAAAVDDGVPGGTAGGVPDGVVGGLAGGLSQGNVPSPPAVPPPAVTPNVPVRVGGQIKTPALLHRVEPIYPDLAVRARLQGVVILEATVDEQGDVADVRVLRALNPLLDREAMTAVRQWRYTPLQLNGIPVRFVLTVTLAFHLERADATE